jgi:hypothetical protein
MTRRRLLCGLLLASAVLVCFAGWLWMRDPGVTGARFEQVKKGMTREEVIRTVGGPPGDYQTIGFSIAVRAPDTPIYSSWVCDTGYLFVEFDEHGVATDVRLHTSNAETLTERIRRWLGL